jgi:hypothetical protein
MPLVVDKYLSVLESDGLKDTGINLKNGDWLDISAAGSIWPGFFFTPANGPQGWAALSASGDFPLAGAAPYCLLGHTAEDGYFYLGQGIRRTYQNATLGPGETKFQLEINDGNHGNGSGSFTVRLQVWRE